MPIRWVEDLFERLRAILGTAMATVFAGADPDRVKAEWAQALATFSADEVKRGVAACRTRRFAPNLPEFLHLCRPSLDPETAWIEAAEGLRSHSRHELFAWSHPAVYWSARTIAYELRTGAFAQHRKRWEMLLTAEFAKGVWADPPDPRVKALSNEQGTFRPEFASETRERLAEIRRKMTGHPTKAEELQAQQLQRAESTALADGSSDSEGGEL